MADVKWIKIAVNMFSSRKIKNIENMPDGDALLVIWFKLMCLAGTINDKGSIYITPSVPFGIDDLANELNKPVETVARALDIFEKFDMIETVDGIISLTSWEKYQNIDGLEKIRSQTNERVKRYREKQKLQHQEPNDIQIDPKSELRPCGKSMEVLLTEEQYMSLLAKMDIDTLNYYCNRIEDCIVNKGYNIRSHYNTILKWWREDRKA